MKNWRNYIIILLAGAIAVLILRSSCNSPLPPAPVVIPVKEQVKQVEKNEEAGKKVIDSLQKILTIQAQTSSQLKQKLSQAQLTARQMEDIINNWPKDSTEPCPPIQDYITNSRERDTICNRLIASHEKQLSLKDAMLAQKDTLYSQLRSSFNTAMDQQTILADYNSQLKKQLRRKKLGNIIWKGAAVAAVLFILKTAIK